MQISKIANVYKKSQNIYDDVLTQNNCLTKLYIKIFWNVDDFTIADKVLRYIPENFNGTLLDVPAGTAVFTYKKYKEIKNSKITCLDYSKEMLHQAKQRFKSESLDHITCIQGDVGNLLFNDETFDIVLSMNGFHAFSDKEKAFTETARVLKKDGIFIGCFYIKKEKFLTDTVVNAFLSHQGWFTPPFYTKIECADILKTLYSKVEIYNNKAMAWFYCRKQLGEKR